MFTRLITTLVLAVSSLAWADTPLQVCLILDKAGKNDRSFNQEAYEGFTQAQKDFKIAATSKYVIAQDDAQAGQFVRTFSNRNCGLIIAVGFNNAEVVKKVASNFPSQKFAVVDASFQAPNILSMLFQEHEGSFLVGAIAALKTKTNKVAFIGGMDIPLIRRFFTGFKAGVHYVNANIKITDAYLGITASAWANPTKAKELATSLYKLDNDIIFVAAGASSQGVFDAVQQTNSAKNPKFVIGVDANQNYIAPGLVLTSMEKKVQLEVYNTIKEYLAGAYKPGVRMYGIENGGIDWAYDKYNKSLFSAADLKTIENIKQKIKTKKITVPDYYKEVHIETGRK